SDEEKPEASTKGNEADKDKEKEKEKDQDKSSKDGESKAKAEPAPVRIDLDDLDQRVLDLPLPARNYAGLLAGKEKTLYLLEGPAVRGLEPDEDTPDHAPAGATLRRFDLEKRKAEKLLEGVRSVEVSHDGKTLLYRQGEKWFLASASSLPKPPE